MHIISIHAPARGATTPEELGQMYKLISIHAPARGATIGDFTSDRQRLYFNPRSREGSDE